MGALPGTPPTGAALTAAKVGGGPEVAAAASSAQRQRAQIDGIKAKRKPSRPAPAGQQQATPPPDDSSPGGGPPDAFTDQRGAPGWYRSTASTLADPVAAGNAGGGFLLGIALWAVGLAYLKNGPAGVRQLLAAKFLNRVPA